MRDFCLRHMFTTMSKLLIFCTIILFCTFACKGQPTTIDGFFDKDLLPDKITVEDEDNRASSSFHITCNFSTLSTPIIFDCTYYYSDFLFVCPIPSVVTHEDAFTDKLARVMIPAAKTPLDSNGFRWITQVCMNSSNKAKMPPAVNFKSSFTIHWHTGMPDIKRPSFTKVPADFPLCMGHNYSTPAIKAKSLILGYIGNNHNAVIRTFDIPGYQVITTRHGVLLKKGDLYAWVFINDKNTFGIGSEKLRWPTVTDVTWHNNCLLIKTIAIPSDIKSTYVVCMDSWDVFRLKNNNDTSVQTLNSLCY